MISVFDCLFGKMTSGKQQFQCQSGDNYALVDYGVKLGDDI